MSGNMLTDMTPVYITIGIVAGVLVLIALIFVIWYFSTANTFRRMMVKIDEAESGIDVALTKRFDLLTKAIDTVKGYTKHEKEVIYETTGMRCPKKDAPMAEKSAFAGKLDEVSKSIHVVAENYPTLRADTQFTALQADIAEVEEHLQAARRLFNSNVSVYNQKLVSFPSSA